MLGSRIARMASRRASMFPASVNFTGRSVAAASCTINKSIRFYSTKKEADNSKEKKPESILTEDILARAGFEDPEASTKASVEGAAETSEAEGSSTSSGGSSRRRRRAQTSKDLQREKYANWFYISSFVAGLGGLGYMARDWDSEEEAKNLEASDIENGYTPGLMYARLNKRLSSFFTFFSEPVFENLLPPPAPEAYRRPLTLVLTLDDLLIHSEWDTKNGWRTAKRPGLDYFLGYLLQYYEIVIFGLNYQMYSEQTVAKMDPLHAYISYALYREACRYKDGKLIKDLLLLNRDLGKTILVDIDSQLWDLQPENAIPMKPWDGKADDTLIRLIPLLEYLATQPVKDVRPILLSFGNKENIISDFEQREIKLREQWKKENAHLLNRSNQPNVGNFVGQLLGIPQSKVNREPKMPLDIIREHGQMQYEQFQKYLKENSAKFLEEEQKLKEQFGKVTLNKLMTEGAPSAEDIAKAQAERAQAEAAN